MEALSAAGYRVVAPDMRGFGKTEAPEETNQALLKFFGLSQIVPDRNTYRFISPQF